MEEAWIVTSFVYLFGLVSDQQHILFCMDSRQFQYNQEDYVSVLYNIRNAWSVSKYWKFCLIIPSILFAVLILLYDFQSLIHQKPLQSHWEIQITY